ncbi:protein of unknown function [Paraburkholderia kururiensis]
MGRAARRSGSPQATGRQQRPGHSGKEKPGRTFDTAREEMGGCVGAGRQGAQHRDFREAGAKQESRRRCRGTTGGGHPAALARHVAMAAHAATAMSRAGGITDYRGGERVMRTPDRRLGRGHVGLVVCH